MYGGLKMFDKKDPWSKKMFFVMMEILFIMAIARISLYTSIHFKETSGSSDFIITATIIIFYVVVKVFSPFPEDH